MKTWLLLATLVSVTWGAASSAQAESRVGSGGYGVVVDNQIYALDLAARGVHHNPYIGQDERDHLPPDLQDLVDYHLSRVTTDDVIAVVSTKLAELSRRLSEAQIHYEVGSIVRAMDSYHWINMVDLQCVDVGDDQSPFPHKVQLAFRQDSWIRFCGTFNALDVTNKAALILHEMVYGLHTEAQPFVSNLIGFLFSPDFQRFTTRDISELTRTVGGLIDSDPVVGPPADISLQINELKLLEISDIPTDIITNPVDRLHVRLHPSNVRQLLLSGRAPGQVEMTLVFRDQPRKVFTVDVVR